MKKIILIITLTLFLSSCVIKTPFIWEKHINHIDSVDLIYEEVNLEKDIKTQLESNLINYKEVSLNIDEKSKKFEDNAFILDELARKYLKTFYNWKAKNSNKFEYISYFNVWWPCWKIWDECPNWAFWMTHDFLIKMLDWWFTEFYKNEKWKIFVTSSAWVFTETGTIIDFKNENIEIFTWTNWAVKNLWEYNWKIGFDFMFLDIKSNKKFNDLMCENIITLFDKNLKKCENKANLIKIEKDKIEAREKCFEGYDDNLEHNKCMDLKYSDEFRKRNIYYNWELFNEKYKVDSSKKLFIYNWKVGFIAEKNWKQFIIFDWKQVSNSFDEIRTQTCCMSMAYPFHILDKWLLIFVFKRDWKYFIWYNYLEWKK